MKAVKHCNRCRQETVQEKKGCFFPRGPISVTRVQIEWFCPCGNANRFDTEVTINEYFNGALPGENEMAATTEDN
jgi:hypothetical protein